MSDSFVAPKLSKNVRINELERKECAQILFNQKLASDVAELRRANELMFEELAKRVLSLERAASSAVEEVAAASNVRHDAAKVLFDELFERSNILGQRIRALEEQQSAARAVEPVDDPVCANPRCKHSRSVHREDGVGECSLDECPCYAFRDSPMNPAPPAQASDEELQPVPLMEGDPGYVGPTQASDEGVNLEWLSVDLRSAGYVVGEVECSDEGEHTISIKRDEYDADPILSVNHNGFVAIESPHWNVAEHLSAIQIISRHLNPSTAAPSQGTDDRALRERIEKAILRGLIPSLRNVSPNCLINIEQSVDAVLAELTAGAPIQVADADRPALARLHAYLTEKHGERGDTYGPQTAGQFDRDVAVLGRVVNR